MKKNGKLKRVNGKEGVHKKIIINEQIRVMVASGNDEEKIVATVVRIYKGRGKDEAWALRRAKAKLSYVKRQASKSKVS